MDMWRRKANQEPVRRIAGWASVWSLTALILLLGLPGIPPAFAENPATTIEEWMSQTLKRLFSREKIEPRKPTATAEPHVPPPGVMRLTLDEAMARFLELNLDLLISNYGIESSKGRQITAQLFPNPTLSVNTLSAYTQDCNLNKCGAVAPSLSQLFEVAGKRGYRIRAAELDTLSAEARFEDTIRQLGYTLKETYFSVQRQHGHLAVDQEVLDTMVKLLQGSSEKNDRTVSESDRVRLGLLTVNAEAEVLQDLQRIEEASGDLRMMLRISPDVELDLVTDLTFRPTKPDLPRLIQYALENRADIRALRIVRDKRKTELQLAKAARYPNVTAQLGYSMQGPRGPDNQQQWGFGLSAPLPVFNRNQGGIVEAEVALRTAEANVDKADVVIRNEVAVAFRKFVHGRRLVEATTGALDRASMLFRAAQEGYTKNQVGILDLENTRRSYGDTEESHLEALFGYQQSLLKLERAAGRDIMF